MRRPANHGKPWTRDQLVLAFELYCRIPFRLTKASDPRVAEHARLLGRTPASVARKLGNFGAFDPQLKARNISGLPHGSKLDKAVWDEFHNDWGGLVLEAYDIRREFHRRLRSGVRPAPPEGPSEKSVPSKQRLHQSFFREVVLSSYNGRCCVTGLPVPECLVAAHIIPWSVEERRRADPTNGLCLSATFERLFDTGLVSVSERMQLDVSHRLLDLADTAVAEEIASRHGQRILVPSRFEPDPACLRWHHENVFCGR